MPTYDYYCNKCAKCEDDPEAVFEARYSFSATPEEIAESTICPTCDGYDVIKLITPPVDVRVKGHMGEGGWHDFKTKNAAAIQRDQNLYILENKDPYAHMRQPGEVDDMKHRIKAARQKSTKPIYFT